MNINNLINSRLSEDGEMTRLIRDFDWAGTSLGERSGWHESLRDAVAGLLDSLTPTMVLWGPEFIQIYNDAYRPMLESRHPAALGQRAQDCWPENWAFNESLYREIQNGGISIHIEAPECSSVGTLPNARYFAMEYSPVYEEPPSVGGIRAVAKEPPPPFSASPFVFRQLQQMFEQAPGFMILLHGPDYVIELANLAARRLLGDREIVGRILRVAIPEIVDQVFLTLLDEAYVSGSPVIGTEVPFTLSTPSTVNPALRYLTYIYQPLKDKQGRVVGLFIEGCDVTEKKQTADALAQAHQHIIQRLVIEENLFLDKARAEVILNSISMNVRAVQRQVIETSLRHALARGQLVLHYQSKVNLATGKITGAEALLRWVHPQWGVMPPNHFVPVAEDCGLIVPIGRWVLREACLQAQRWKNAGLELGSIAVNISALEFRCKGFVDGVRAILEETGLPSNCLQLEITESVLMRDAESSTQVLHQLKNMGVQLAVDDFGTGYSSLSYLNKFPIDVLKIDRSFVHDILTAKGNSIIVSAVIAMGTSLKQQVVAEGVEQQTQVDFLKGQHCEEGQGFFFSQPLCARHFAMLLGNCH